MCFWTVGGGRTTTFTTAITTTTTDNNSNIISVLFLMYKQMLINLLVLLSVAFSFKFYMLENILLNDIQSLADYIFNN